MGGGGNQKWTGNWDPIIIPDPIPKARPGKSNIKGYDIEGIPGFPSPKTRRNRSPKRNHPSKKLKKDNKIDELDLLFGRVKTPKTTPILTKYQKWQQAQKNKPQNIAKRAAEKQRRQAWKSLSPEEKETKLVYDKFMNKKGSTFFKKHGRPATLAEQKPWKKEFQQYQSQQERRNRTEAERLFGKMTDRQWKEHQQKRSQFRQKEEQKRQRGY